MEVQITLPPGTAERELQLPVWNALYQVRDFAQYVNWIRAKDPAGKPLTVVALDKSRWQVQRCRWGDRRISDLRRLSRSLRRATQLASCLLQPRANPDVSRRRPQRALDASFQPVPPEWHIATPLHPYGAFLAENYDRAVDSPVEISTFHESDFDEAGGHYRVIIDADPADYDLTKIIANLHKIVAAATSWMNDRPFETYTFFYHFPRGPAGGGMEHAYSTAIELNADSMTQTSLRPHCVFRPRVLPSLERQTHSSANS